MVVGTDRPGQVAQVSLEQHQVAVADFLERLQLDPTPRHLRGTGQVTGPCPCGAEQIAKVRALTVEL